jgi:hypothetical protein
MDLVEKKKRVLLVVMQRQRRQRERSGRKRKRRSVQLHDQLRMVEMMMEGLLILMIFRVFTINTYIINK